MKLSSVLLPLAFGAALSVSAQVISFDLTGLGGNGLLPTNENPAATNGSPGTGGEIGGGITFDTSTNILSINIGWGSGNGFTDLSGAATAAHIHGPADQSTNAGVAQGIMSAPFTFDTSATSGSVVGSIDITTTAITSGNLLAGLYYINVHTAANPGGEIRGNLVAIPEPSALGFLLGLGGLALIATRRRR